MSRILSRNANREQRKALISSNNQLEGREREINIPKKLFSLKSHVIKKKNRSQSEREREREREILPENGPKVLPRLISEEQVEIGLE